MAQESFLQSWMNPHVYITYRHIVSGVVMLPFAYFLERKERPKLTFALFLELFVLSLLGVGLTLNMYFASLRYTSPTFLASMVNTIASVTFVIAVALRLEALNLEIPAGPHCEQSMESTNPYSRKSSIHENWLKGSILTVASCITWSAWYIMQAITLKRYPAQLSLTTWMSFIGAAQSAVFTVCIEHKRAAWAVGFNIDFWSILYAGVVCSGLIIFIHYGAQKRKDQLYIGSILGAAIVIVGLYLLLWGKKKDALHGEP
ncbi:hypothetical protein M0R45_000155 [Rubus argutus]|uniref:WAT1-related protein n=1 Tax=Rubus argutus TaxID=59490 RepID=A0AAW1VQ13_RUBAR